MNFAILFAALALAMSTFPKVTTIAKEQSPLDRLALPVSQDSVDMIIHYEVGGRSYYESRLTRPTVPAWRTTASGVTVGFGFDVGYNTPAQIADALQGVATEREIEALQSVAGLKGKAAYYNGLPKVRYIVHFTYEEAEEVFQRDSLPRFSKLTASAFGLSRDQLHPHSNGALVSLVFNRGSSMSSRSSRREMRWIKHNLASGNPEKVPGDIRAMKRLWSYTKLKGLHKRRDAEAEMFQRGLN